MFTKKKYYLEPGEQGVIIINGTINGDIIGAEDVIVTSTGSCNCNINARKLIVDGMVEGNIDVETLVIDTGKLYYNQAKINRLLIGTQGFIAHKSDTQTKKIPEDFVGVRTDKSADIYKELDNKIDVNLKHFKLYLNNATSNDLEDTQDYRCMERNTVNRNTEQKTKSGKYHNINIVQQFYTSY